MATDTAKLFGPRGQMKIAVLATVAERPGHGYALAGRLNTRLGPSWEIERKRVYELLAQLEKEGLIEGEQVTRTGEWHRLYRVTPLAEEALEEWMTKRGRVPLIRADLHAQIGFAKPQDAKALLLKLDLYEQDCLQALQSVGVGDVEATAWRSRMIALSRAGTEEQLRAELKWIVRARRELKEHLAECP